MHLFYDPTLSRTDKQFCLSEDESKHACKVMRLKEGDSMMPFYRKSFYNNEKYNWVYTCNSDEGHHGWVSEHNLIAEWYHEVKIKKVNIKIFRFIANEYFFSYHIIFDCKNN